MVLSYFQYINAISNFLQVNYVFKGKTSNFKQTVRNTALKHGVTADMTFGDTKVALTNLICLCFPWGREKTVLRLRLTLGR